VFNFSEDQITTAMQLARKKAKLDDLRQETTCRLFELTDLDVMEIKAVTGHKTLQMLARHTQLRTARLADRLAGMKRG